MPKGGAARGADGARQISKAATPKACSPLFVIFPEPPPAGAGQQTMGAPAPRPFQFRVARRNVGKFDADSAEIPSRRCLGAMRQFEVGVVPLITSVKAPHLFAAELVNVAPTLDSGEKSSGTGAPFA